MELKIYENVRRHEHRFYNLVNSQNSNKRSMVETVIRKTTSQIYKVHGFIPNSCEIYYFIGLYWLNMNVVHYLNMKVECMIFICKQHK